MKEENIINSNQDLDFSYPGLNHLSSIIIQTIQKLSLAKNFDDITQIVRHQARALLNADGATFILRRDNECHYVDEEAIGPLWKGMKFPLNACISGWSMLNNQQVYIPDIYQDERIPHDAYRPTFVKSLLMTPVRHKESVAAIGIYWAKTYQPSQEEKDTAQALADSTLIAIKNLSAMEEIKNHLNELEKTNHRLNRFTWIISHDLKEPIRSIGLNLSFLEKNLANFQDIQQLHNATKTYIGKMQLGIKNAFRLIADLVEIAKIENYDKTHQAVDLNESIRYSIEMLKDTIDGKKNPPTIEYNNLPTIQGDPILVSRLLQNILSNSIKFQPEGKQAKIRISATLENSFWKISIKDNGIGILEQHRNKVFEFFNYIHNRELYPGSGVGLAICKKILDDVGGKIWFESKENVGCTMHFTLPRNINEKK